MAIDFSQAVQSTSTVPALQTERALQTPSTAAEQRSIQPVEQALPTAAQTAAESVGQNAQTDAVNATNASEQSADNNVTDEQVSEAISNIQTFVESNQRNLNFSVDEDSRRSIVSVTDASSGDVIRQIPSEEVLQLAERIRELQTEFGSAVGVFFNREV